MLCASPRPQAVCAATLVGRKGTRNTIQVGGRESCLNFDLSPDDPCRVPVKVEQSTEADDVTTGPRSAHYALRAGLPQFKAYLKGHSMQ